jgi:ElaB/YqjD/DUF883 family membrane-anchored ribosome-binding protein
MATAWAELMTEPCAWPTREAFEETVREARRVATTARRAAEDAVAQAELTIRRHPLRAVSGAAGVAALAGALAGFGAGWLSRARR